MDILFVRERILHPSAFGRLRQQFGDTGCQQTVAVFQLAFAVAVGQEPIVPDALKAGRQGMDEETPLELVCVNRHGSRFFAVFASIVFPLKRHPAVIEREQAMVGDRDPMRVAAEVFQRSLRTAEWGLRPVAKRTAELILDKADHWCALVVNTTQSRSSCERSRSAKAKAS